MTNGCICCTLREDLLVEVRKLAGHGRFDCLAHRVHRHRRTASGRLDVRVSRRGRTTACRTSRVSIPWSRSWMRPTCLPISSHDFLRERGEVAGPGDERYSGRPDRRADRVRRCHRPQQGFRGLCRQSRVWLAPSCARSTPMRASLRLISAKCRCPRYFFTGRFDFEKAQQHPLSFKELNGFKDHVPETEEYGVRSFVYRSRRPVPPGALSSLLQRVLARRDPRQGLFLACHPAAVRR